MNNIIPNNLYKEASKYGFSVNETDHLLDGFSKSTLEASKNVCFVMFSPDSVSQNAINDILLEHKLIILKYKYLNITETCEDVYQNDIISRKLHSWWIKNKVFNLGNTLVAIVTCLDIPTNHQNIYCYLLDIKGASSPTLSKKGTIRYEYRVSSKSFGFMHSSDDNFSSLKEALSFFSVAEITEAINDAYNNVENKLNFDCRLKTSNIELNFYYLLYKIKKHIILSLKEEFPKTFVEELLCIYDQAIYFAILHLPFNEEKELFIPILLSEKEIILRYWNQSINNLILINRSLLSNICLLYKLSDYEHFSQVNSTKLLHQIENIGLKLDDWEKLLLMSSLYFYCD